MSSCSQQEQRLRCRGPGPRASTQSRPSLQACRPGQVVGARLREAPGSGGRFDGLQSGRCRPPRAGMDYTGPQCLAHLAPSWALCLPTLAPGHLPGLGWGGGGGKDIFHSLGRLCQGWLSTCGLVTQREKAEGGRVLGSLVQEQ